MIYFAKLPTGAIKIGHSVNPDQRSQALRSHYGCDLEILRTMEGGRDVERELHERFSHLRLGRTEQFRPGPDLAEFIGLPLFVSPNPETVEAQGVPRDTKPVRLELSLADIARLERVARSKGLSNAAYARQAVLLAIRADERS